MITIGDMRVYTSAEAAKILGMTQITVREWLRRGTIRGVRHGGRWRVTEEELKRLMTPVQAGERV